MNPMAAIEFTIVGAGALGDFIFMMREDEGLGRHHEYQLSHRDVSQSWLNIRYANRAGPFPTDYPSQAVRVDGFHNTKSAGRV